MLIRISGVAYVDMEDGGDLEGSDLLSRLDGLESDELCSDYMDAELADLGIAGGSVKLEHIGSGEFRVVSEYRSPVRLGEAQLERLIENTVGQWSDGIGEGCFYELMADLGVMINVSPAGQESSLRIEQVDDGALVEGPNLLATAAREGNLALLKDELASGADIERRLQGYTPLHLAVIYGRAAAALELIERGADVLALDPIGDDPLMLAALSSSISDDDAATIATALLERGVSPNGRRDCSEDPLAGGESPLKHALGREKFNLVRVLRTFGAMQ